MKSNKKIRVKVFRYDPAKDKEAYYVTYEVPYTPYMSVLQVLEYIRENLDGTLAFPHHAVCLHGACGTCTAKVNGKPVLLCQKIVTEDLEEITVEPLSKEKVVRDLVIKR